MTFNCPKCQKALTARDDQGGARVKCPHCGAVLQVPGRAAVQPAGAQPTARQPAAQRVCPGCGAALPATAVLCVQCGYDFRQGAVVLRPVAASKRAKRPKGNRKLLIGVGVGAGVVVVVLVVVIALWPSGKGAPPAGGQPVAAGVQPGAPLGPGAPPGLPSAGPGVAPGSAPASPASAAAPAASPGGPQFPGAVTTLPAEMLADAPFDLAKYFASPPPEENAAPLYLDALYELSRDVAYCFPKEERDRRDPIVSDRGKRLIDLQIAQEKQPGSVSPQAIDAMLAECEPAFQKLALAQKRRGCLFQNDIGIAALLGHAQAARHVARLVKMRASRAVDRGAVDQALQDLEMVLRLTRDIVRRGPLITALVAYAMQQIICNDIVPAVLGAKDLNASQCDRLLAILAKHEAERGDPFMEGMRGEYVMLRKIVHDLQHRRTEWAKEMWDALGIRGDTRSAGVVFITCATDLSDRLDGPTREAMKATGAPVIDARLAAMGPDDFAAEVKAVNEAYRSWESAAKQPYRSRMQELQRMADELRKGNAGPQQFLEEIKAKKMPLISVFFPAANAFSESNTRTLAMLRGTQCLIALKRWQLEKGAAGQDLAAITKAAGMAHVPIDPYADQPFRMATVAGQAVVYSIGPDGKDDEGAVSWNEQHQFRPDGPGDYTFRLPAATWPRR